MALPAQSAYQRLMDYHKSTGSDYYYELMRGSAESVGDGLEELNINDDYDYEEDYEEVEKPKIYNPVEQAVRDSDVSALKTSLKNPDNIQYLNKWHDIPPLHRACYNDDLQCVDVLLHNENVDLTLPDGTGFTPIHIVCAGGNLELLERLLKTFEEFGEPYYDDLVNIRNIYLQTPLHAAAGGHNPTELVPYLLDHGAYASSKDYLSWYPSDHCHDEHVKTILKKAEELEKKAEELEKKGVDKPSA